VSCITNVAAGLSARPLSHEEVAETANRASEAFARLLSEALPRAAKRST
jgi:purine-nucleoside phosphorylase